MNRHAYWLAAAVVGLAGCAGNPEPVKVPQKKAESGCFLNCEIPENLGKQYLDGALPGIWCGWSGSTAAPAPITASSVPRAGW